MKLQFKRTSLVERVFKGILLGSNKVIEKMPNDKSEEIYKDTIQISKLLRENKCYKPQDKRVAKNMRKTDSTVRISPVRKKVDIKAKVENVKSHDWVEVKARQKAGIGKVDNHSLSKRFF